MELKTNITANLVLIAATLPLIDMRVKIHPETTVSKQTETDFNVHLVLDQFPEEGLKAVGYFDALTNKFTDLGHYKLTYKDVDENKVDTGGYHIVDFIINIISAIPANAIQLPPPF